MKTETEKRRNGESEAASPSHRLTASALSPAQRIVLRGIAEGKMTKEIAAEIGVSESGVNYHKARIYKVLGVTSNVEAARRYWQAFSPGFGKRPVTVVSSS